jgi:hypothetical protein
MVHNHEDLRRELAQSNPEFRPSRARNICWHG